MMNLIVVKYWQQCLKPIARCEVVSICNNASEALAAIRQDSPDIVFLDVEMPRMNGFEMLEQLLTSTFTSFLPPVMINMP